MDWNINGFLRLDLIKLIQAREAQERAFHVCPKQASQLFHLPYASNLPRAY